MSLLIKRKNFDGFPGFFKCWNSLYLMLKQDKHIFGRNRKKNDTVSERRITERWITGRRIIERRITERRITERQKLPNAKLLNVERYWTPKLTNAENILTWP